MGPRRAFGWIVVATLVVTGTVTATGGGVSAGPPADPPARAGKGEVGTWSVRSLGGEQYAVAWTSPSPLPVTSDRPTIVGPSGLHLETSTVSANGRTVTALVTSAERPDPDQLDVLLSGDRLDEPGVDHPRRGGAPSSKRLDLPGTQTLADDPATPGDLDVVTSDYRLARVRVHGLRKPIEMIGHVVEPAADAPTGPRPLVLFLHGRHSYCYDPADPGADGRWPCRAPLEEIPSQLGYDYIQRVLASQGYATVSIRVNGINAQDGGLADAGADARAVVIEAHLDHWVDLAPSHQVDLGRVVLVGHSRGGEGVNRASIQIPLSAPYRIAGQVLIAPTDFAGQTAPYVPTLTLLPFCDGDVSDLQGQRFTDLSRDLTTDDSSLKSTVLVMGANHNFFNTEWTPGAAQAPAFDDWYGTDEGPCGTDDPERLTAVEQQAVGTAYVAGAVHLFADGDEAALPLFDGSRATVASLGDAQTLSHAIGGGRDVRAPGIGAGRAPADGAGTRFCQGTINPSRAGSCAFGVRYAMVAPHWPGGYPRLPARSFFEMTWTSTGQAGGLELAEPLDLTERRLDLRTIVDPRSRRVDLRVRITDADGASALLTPVGGGRLPALGGGPGVEKFWGQTLTVDLADDAAVDLSRISQVELVSHSKTGRIWVADLAAAPSGLAAVPDLRVPTLNIGKVRIAEGDGPTRSVAQVPFTVVGDVTRPSRFVAVTSGQGAGGAVRLEVEVAPGQTSGTIPIAYEADRRDDYPKLRTEVSAWGTRNLMTDDYLGEAVVLDDDPTPRVRAFALERSVDEGSPAVWRFKLGRRVDYAFSVTGKIVRGPGTNVSVADISRSWTDVYVGQVDPDLPLWKASPMVYDFVRPGQRYRDVRVPTAHDRLDEPRESLTVRFNLPGKRVTRTIRVTSP